MLGIAKFLRVASLVICTACAASLICAVTLAVVLLAGGCSAPVPDEVPSQVTQASSTTYNILVLEMSRTGATVTWPHFSLDDPFATAVKRISYNGSSVPFTHGIAPQYDIMPPFTATPAQVGCGGPNEQHTAMQFAVNHVLQMGVNLAPYKHIWLVADDQHSFVPDCPALYGTSGGRNFGYAGLVDNTFGMVWTANPNSADTTVHEFEHGYAPSGLAHEYVLNCPTVLLVQSASTQYCVRSEVGQGGMPRAWGALGAGALGDPDPLFNESGWYKLQMGWIDANLVMTVQPNQSGYTSLNALDQLGSTFPVLVKVVRWDGRVILFERRAHAPVGNNGTTNAPGVYVYVVEPAEDPVRPALLASTSGGAGFLVNIHPLPQGVRQVEPGLVVQDNSPFPGFFRVTCNKPPGQVCP